jgi:hypothetical protein
MAEYVALLDKDFEFFGGGRQKRSHIKGSFNGGCFALRACLETNNLPGKKLKTYCKK